MTKEPLAQVRILYIPNERTAGGQRGIRQAFQAMVEQQAVDAVQIFSPLLRLAADPTVDINTELQAAASAFGPTIIFVQHLAGSKIEARTWRSLKEHLGCTIVYHEGDIYDRLRKPYPKELKAIARFTDFAFTVGASSQIRAFTKFGFTCAEWVPSVYNHHDFGNSGLLGARAHDVIMIANDSSSRVPFASMPGSTDRRKLAKLCTSRFQERFAVYGRGWPDALNATQIDYTDQSDAILDSWLTVCWDHYPQEHRFFSDRLPISLATGSIHVTSRHSGYEKIFPSNVDFIHFAESPREVCDIAQEILEGWDIDRKVQAISAGRDFAARFRQDLNLLEMLCRAGMNIDESTRSAVLGSRSSPIPGH